MVVYAEGEPLQDYFGIQKRILKIVGLSLSPNLNVFYKAYSYSIVLVMILYTFLMLPDLIKPPENFDDYVDSWLFASGYIVVMTKLLTLFPNRSRLNNILNALQSGVFVPNPKYGGKMEIIWLKHCVTLTTKLTIVASIVGLGTMLVCATGYYIYHWKTGSLKLPFGSVSILTNHWNYEMTLFYQILVYGFGVEVLMIVDVVNSCILAHICVQCKILQNFIRRSIKISRRNMAEEKSCPDTDNSKIPYKYLQQTLRKSVDRHIGLLKVAENVEDVFNLPTLGVFTSMGVCFCFIMYQGSLYPFSDPMFLKDFFVLITAMLPLTLNSYWGSEVLFASRAVADACYEVDFVGTDVRFQKALVLIIQRSQKPMKLTVGKFATLSLVTMLAVLRLSYSSFMLLRKVNQP